jgi:hypothetical protein
MNPHPPRPHIKQPAHPRHPKPNPPQPIGINVLHNVLRALLAFQLRFPIQRHFGGKSTLGFGVFARGLAGREGVEGCGGQHEGRRHDEVHGVDGGAVEFVEVKAGDVVVGVDEVFVALVISCQGLRGSRRTGTGLTSNNSLWL